MQWSPCLKRRHVIEMLKKPTFELFYVVLIIPAKSKSMKTWAMCSKKNATDLKFLRGKNEMTNVLFTVQAPTKRWFFLDLIKGAWQFFVTFLGWLSDLLERLSNLQLGDKKVTTWITWWMFLLFHVFHFNHKGCMIVPRSHPQKVVVFLVVGEGSL